MRRVRAAALHLADREPWRAGQRVRLVELRAAAVRHAEAAAAAALLRQPLGIGEGEERRRVEAGQRRLALPRRPRHARPALRRVARGPGARAPVAAEAVEARGEIAVAAAEARLRQERGDVGRRLAFAGGGALDDHVGEARRQRQPGEAAPVRRQAAGGIAGAEPVEQVERLLVGGAGRRVEPGELARVGDAPGEQRQRERGEVGRGDLRRVEGGERGRLRLVPQAVAEARPGAAGAAAALVGRRARDTHRLEPRQARARLVARPAGEPRIDDEPHALDGQRGLGDRGREHDLAAARRRRPDRGVLRPRLHRPEERREIDVGRQPPLEPLRRAADLGLARQEGEDRAVLLGEPLSDRRRHPVLHPRGRIAAEIDGLDRKQAALALDDRRAAEEIGETAAVEGRGHGEKPQVLAQRPLRLARQGEAEIHVERPLVHLVEQHRRDAVEGGIVEDHADEDAGGDELDARRGGHLRVVAHAVARRPPRLLAQPLRDAMGGGAGGQAARLDDDDAPLAPPRRGEKGRRHARRLAGAGRRDQHRAGARLERRQKLGQDLGDGQRVGQVGVSAQEDGRPALRSKAPRRNPDAVRQGRPVRLLPPRL